MANSEVKGIRLIVGYIGVFIVLIGIICLLPLIVLVFYPNEYIYAYCYIIPGVSSIVIGYLLSLLIRGKDKGRLEQHQSSALVVIVWALAILICAFPFILTGKYNFTQAVFESTSGFSTTGLSVVDVESAAHILLFYRSILLFFGGVGLVLVLTSAISDRYSLNLYSAEGHTDRLLPNLIKSARLILSIYFGYIVIGVIFYVIFGMSVFDAVNTSMAALSTGGFSTKSASIGAYNSLPIEIITIVLMLLGSTNFFIHLALLKGKFKNAINHIETKFFIILIVFIFPLLVETIFSFYKGNFWEAVRVGIFQFVSALTTTGFQTVPTFNGMPQSFILLMILLMLIGGESGSTAGGIKQYRFALFLKSIYWSLRNKLPYNKIIRSNFVYKYGQKEIVSSEEENSNAMFVGIYLLIFIVGTYIFTLFGYSISDSMFEFASSLGTVGLSVGITGFNANPIILWTSTIGMFLGRLEIVIVFVSIAKGITIIKRRLV